MSSLRYLLFDGENSQVCLSNHSDKTIANYWLQRIIYWLEFFLKIFLIVLICFY